jgi:hypothetical protein
MSRSLVGLAVLVCLAFGPVSTDAQTMKIATQTSASVNLPKAPASATAPADLNIVCQPNGTAVLEFLVATASGGTAPYNFSVTPAATAGGGYRFSKSSVFATVPLGDAGKNDQFNVTVKDKKGTTVPKSCTVTIALPPKPGALTVGCPGPGYVGAAFQIASVSGGTPPYTYAAPSLPKQLVLDPNTGLVTGASTPGVVPDQTINVVDKNGTQASTPTSCAVTVLPQPPGSVNCTLFPVAHGSCVRSGVAKNANINSFWQTNGSFVFFNQIKSIYNESSNSATVSADMGTLNFPIGMQLNIGTNIQAGSVPPTPVSTGTIPTLSPTAAAQAAQNMLYGGTIFASAAYPLLALGGNRINSAGNWGGMLDVAGREGVDIQSFKSGTSTGATSPSSHSSLQVEGYVQMNSTNLPTVGGGTFAGALFVGGSYGYSYTSHQYISDYGMANASNRLGQVSAGILLNGVAKLAFSKAFGPSQTYFDGTVTPTPTKATTVNNFKAWSFELSYQSAAPGTK